MKEIKHILRKAYLDRLASLTYLSTSIPVDQDYLNGPAAILPVGNSSKIEAYVIIQNQTVNDRSPKCGIDQDTTLQLDVITVFNANSGNSYHAEMITQAAFNLLFTPDSKRITFTIADMYLWRGWLESSRQIVQETSESKIFRNVLIFQHSISQ